MDIPFGIEIKTSNLDNNLYIFAQTQLDESIFAFSKINKNY